MYDPMPLWLFLWVCSMFSFVAGMVVGYRSATWEPCRCVKCRAARTATLSRWPRPTAQPSEPAHASGTMTHQNRGDN